MRAGGRTVALVERCPAESRVIHLADQLRGGIFRSKGRSDDVEVFSFALHVISDGMVNRVAPDAATQPANEVKQVVAGMPLA
jgi:hypothetical protein